MDFTCTAEASVLATGHEIPTSPIHSGLHYSERRIIDGSTAHAYSEPAFLQAQRGYYASEIVTIMARDRRSQLASIRFCTRKSVKRRLRPRVKEPGKSTLIEIKESSVCGLDCLCAFMMLRQLGDSLTVCVEIRHGSHGS
jgi:hypothetical protein